MDVIEWLWAYCLVFLLAAIPFFELITVIPIAIIAGLSTFLVTLLALLGNLATVLLLMLFMERIRKRRSKRSTRAKKIWDKYGMPGLALGGPFFVGSHLTALMIVSFGSTKKVTIIWMTISLVAWSVLMAVVTHMGADYFYGPDREGFLTRIFE